MTSLSGISRRHFRVMSEDFPPGEDDPTDSELVEGLLFDLQGIFGGSGDYPSLGGSSRQRSGGPPVERTPSTVPTYPVCEARPLSVTVGGFSPSFAYDPSRQLTEKSGIHDLSG